VFVQDGGDALFKQLADWYRNLEQQPLRGNAAVNGTAPIGPERKEILKLTHHYSS
jgi:hypothetical protein